MMRFLLLASLLAALLLVSPAPVAAQETPAWSASATISSTGMT